MADIGKMVSLFGAILLVMTLVFNIMPRWPRFPWDLYIRNSYFSTYIPIISALVLSVILTVIFNFFRS